jgi:Uma2 family endonuclease
MGYQMSRDAYRKWTEGQTTRYERIAGEPVAMSPERVIHARLKARVWRALDRELRAAGLPCEALPDGITVEVGEDTDYEPDAVVNCGEALPDDAVAATNPVIVVEVLSPSTSADDPRVKCPRASFTGKLADYFRVPSIQHYLVVRAKRREVIHHHRGPDGAIVTHTHVSGSIRLDPPGIGLSVEEIYRA